MPEVETFTPPDGPKPIGPYSHIARVGNFITISGTAGVNPVSGELVGDDVYSQTKRILETFAVMLASVGSDLSHVIHINVFLIDMDDFGEMNQAYTEMMGDNRPARTVIGVLEVPMFRAKLTMNLTAVTKE